MSTKKVFIKTFGCQMNVYDSERIVESLAPAGFEETATIEDADLVVLNTCHIREKAAEKVYSELGRIRRVKDDRQAEGRKTTIAVAGCVAQAEGQEIVNRAPVVDLVIGPQAYHNLPSLLIEAETEGRKIVKLDFPERDKFQDLPARRGNRPTSAFLTVQEGCDKFCTFCVVPYTRGMEYSRPASGPHRRGARTGGRRGARTHAARPERQRLPRRRSRRRNLVIGPPDQCNRRDRRPPAPALHHLAPERHERGSHRGPPRQPEADALPSSAIPGGIGPDPGRDEPQAHRPGVPSPDRPYPRRAARHCAIDRHHRRLPRRDGGGVRRNPEDGRRRWFRAGLFVQIQPTARNPRSIARRPDADSVQDRASRRVYRRCSKRAAHAFNRRLCWAPSCPCCSRARAATWARSPGVHPTCRRFTWKARKR